MIHKVKLLVVVLLSWHMVQYAHPLVQKIENNTDFIFSIVYHNDETVCSALKTNNQIVSPHKVYQYPLLLSEKQPGLILKPVGYQDPQTSKQYYFVQDEKVDDKQLEKAFDAWRRYKQRKVFNSAQDWFDKWIGQDVQLTHIDIEVFGYLLDVPFAKIENHNTFDYGYLNFSEGVFSRLHIDIILNMGAKGVKPTMQVTSGQGGVCHDGQLKIL